MDSNNPTVQDRYMKLHSADVAKKRMLSLQNDLWNARVASGVTRVTLAFKLGVALRTLRDWEKRFDSPGTIHLIAWARELGFRLVLKGRHGVLEPPPVELDDGETWELFEVRRIAIALWDARRTAKLSQSDAALLVGVSRCSIQRWEAVETTPKLMAFIAWANCLRYRLVLAGS